MIAVEKRRNLWNIQRASGMGWGIQRTEDDIQRPYTDSKRSKQAWASERASVERTSVRRWVPANNKAFQVELLKTKAKVLQTITHNQKIPVDVFCLQAFHSITKTGPLYESNGFVATSPLLMLSLLPMLLRNVIVIIAYLKAEHC